MADHDQSANADAADRVDIDSLFGVKGEHTVSPSSSNSANTLQDDKSSAAQSHKRGNLSSDSPMSLDDLNLNSLTIEDEGPRLHRGGLNHSYRPHHNLKHSYGSGSYVVPPPAFIRKDAAVHPNAPYGRKTGMANYRNAHTWMSPDVQTQQEFLTIRNSMRRQFKNSEVSKWKLSDYIAHREAMIASQANRLANRGNKNETTRNLQSSDIALETQQNLRKWGLEGNFDQQGNLGRALAEPTIWCKDWLNGKEDVAPWPSMAEMKWEGDDRAKTGVGRFLPLPREEGPHSLQWHQLGVIQQYPMDQVAQVPTMEDVYLPVDAHIEPEKEYLWSKDLEKEIDEFLAS